MAQTIKLKRSATQGKVPSTANLALGEIAINTYDGRVFLKKNDGSDSIQHVVVTDSVTTGSITIFGNISGSWNGHVIDKQYLDDEILNTSLNTFTQSAITITGNGTSGSVAVFNDTHEVTNAAITSVDGGTTITHDNDTNIILTVSGSNGELLTVTDSNTGNLLEVNDASGIDVFVVSAEGNVSSSGAITASGFVLDDLTVANDLTLSGLSSQASEATALMINGSNVVGTRELGDNAFNSTAFTTNTGTVTSVGTNTGLSGTVTTSGNLSLALGDLADMTQAWVTGEDEFIVLDNGTQKRKLSSEIFGSNAFNSTAFATGDNFDADGDFTSLRARGTTKGDVGLGNVENTAISTFAGSSNITTVGTIGTGTWQGTTIDKSYLDDEVLNTSLNSFTASNANTSLNAATGSYLTSTAITITTAAQPNITSLGTLTTLTVDDITIDGSKISDDGEFTLDVGADINLDADGGDIILRDGGTIVGTFSMNQNSGDFDIRSRVQDKDIRLRGNDGGSEITALTLDMSLAGAATFNSTVTATGLTLSSLSNQSSEATALTINGSNVVGTRELGTGAFAAAYSLPEATSTTRGGIELFSDDEQGEAANAVTSTAGRTYGIQLNSNNQAVVNVPWSADGGNATTLDSIDSSGFIRANADDDVSAHTEWQDSKEIRLGTGNDAQIYHNGTNTFFANGTGNLIIRNNTDNGNVVLQSDDGAGGIATYLYLDGTNEKVQIDKPADISDTTQSDAKTTGAFVVDGGVGIAKTLNVGEDVVAFASSDERYKDNITPIENPNEKLKQIGGYTFDWNDKHEVFKGQHDVGVIAQEIEKVLPEIVETRESGYKAVKYEKIVALLIESNKELLKRIEDLESKIK